MSLADLEQLWQHRAFLLTIGGVSVRYWSGAAPPAAVVPNTGGALNYSDLEAVVEVGDQVSAIDPAKGIAAEGGVTVRLAGRGDVETSTDPARQLLRVGWRGASRWATLAATLPHATGGGVTVEVDRSVAAWTIPGLIHVGAEAVWATGTAAAPFRFTGCTRASARTRPQAHIVDAANSRTPLVTQEAVNWRTRWAVLQMANRRPDGSLGTYVDVVRGFIDETPVLDSDGLSVILTVLPNTALLSMRVGGQLAHSAQTSTHLLRGYHHSDGIAATTLEHSQDLYGASTWSEPCNAFTLAGAGLVNVTGPAAAHWALLFDGTLPSPHPRNGYLTDITNAAVYEAAGILPGQILFQDPAAPANNLNQGERLKAADVSEYHALDVHTRGVDQIVSWPSTALNAMRNAATGWMINTPMGATGRWVQCYVDVDGAGRATLLSRLNRPQFFVDLRFAAAPLFAWDAEAGLTVLRKMWYPIDFATPDDGRFFQPRRAMLEPGWERTQRVGYHENEFQRDAIRGVAQAWYQTGEAYILGEGDILDVSAATQQMRVTYFESGEQKQMIVPITAKAVATVAGTDVGYSYTIAASHRQRVPAFGDWPGQEQRCKLEPVAAFREDSPTDIMLKLLISGQGVGTNSATYDVLPFGYNLGTSEVDVASFTGFPVPAEMSAWSPIVTEADTGADILGPMARALGATIVTRFNPTTGERVIALTRARLERALDSVATVANGDFLLGRRPTSETDDKVLNSYVFTINHDPVTGEPGEPRVTFNDVPSIDEHGETGRLELDLRGLRIPTDTPITAMRVLMPIVQMQQAMFAQARRLHEFGLPTELAVRIDPGAIITITATEARGVDGTRGVTAQSVQVRQVRQRWGAEGATVRVINHGVRGTGWAPAMRVTAVVNPNTVTVAANAYTSAIHPITGAALTDVSYFLAADPVECIVRGNFTGRVTTTIGSIVGNDVTLAAAHGLGVGDTIRPREYDAAATRHRNYAYLADAAETLGAANVDGFDIT